LGSANSKPPHGRHPSCNTRCHRSHRQGLFTIVCSALVQTVQWVGRLGSVGNHLRSESQVMNCVRHIHRSLAEEHVDKIGVGVTGHVEVSGDLYIVPMKVQPKDTTGSSSSNTVHSDIDIFAPTFLTCIHPCTLQPSPFWSSGLPPSATTQARRA